MDITVIRGAGDLPGEDIVEPLLATDQAGISRGRAELDFRSVASQEVQLTIKYRSGLKLGNLVEVSGTEEPEIWKGKIKSINHKMDGRTVVTELTIIRPTDFY